MYTIEMFLLLVWIVANSQINLKQNDGESTTTISDKNIKLNRREEKTQNESRRVTV